ncbi:hypothetical protein ABZS66_59265, partial [Dactylosporangium sp. NPDC005572]|uniref:hypothetical protein n=1 Tax=Dactylosporangium sp. NPDC005572 TaxID=3156889 RepID=UPI0033A4248E
CPAQIVVTKWDELEGQAHPRGGVWSRARLMTELNGYPAVRAIGRRRTYRAGFAYGEQGMRVIPVSVVGGAGSTRRGGDQTYRVHAADPVNVEVPFVGLLPDRLDQVYAGQGSIAIDRQLRLARSRLLWTAVWAVNRVLPFTLPLLGVPGPIASIDLSRFLPSYLVDKLELATKRSPDDVRLLRRARKLRESASRSDAARHRVMRAFSDRLKLFDKMYPPYDHRISDSAEPGLVQSLGDSDERRWI